MAKRKIAAKRPPPRRGAARTKNRIRLEWIEAGTLRANPANWRRHPAGQTAALSELLADPDIGWAGVLLYNEATGRLIDGHARKDLVDPAERVPVLVGRWSEDAERRILATLDPLAAAAEIDAGALGELLARLEFDTPGLKALGEDLSDQLAEMEGGRPAANGKKHVEFTAKDGGRITCPKCGHRFSRSEVQG